MISVLCVGIIVLKADMFVNVVKEKKNNADTRFKGMADSIGRTLIL